MDYFEQEGEAAFYGPKIDFMATDAIGREHQVATVQPDCVRALTSLASISFGPTIS